MRFFQIIFLCLWVKSGWATANDSPDSNGFGQSRFMDRSAAELGGVFDMIQDKRGILFLASDHGIQEFDGTNWTTVRGSEKLEFHVLGKGENGRVFAAGPTDFGQVSQDGNGIMTFQSYSSLLSDDNKALAANFVRVVAGASDALFLTESAVFSVSMPPSKPVLHWARSKSPIFTGAVAGGVAYVLTADEGLQRWQTDKMESLAGGDFFRTFSLVPVGDNKLVAATGEGILELSFKDGNVAFSQLAYSDASLIRGRVVRHLEIYDGDFYLGLDRGSVVKVAKDGTVTSWSDDQRDNLGRDIYAHVVDKDGHLWFVTEKGLGVFSGTSTNIGRTLGPESPRVYLRSITGTKDNSTYFGGVYFEEKGGAPTLDPSKLNFTSIPFDDNALRIQLATNNPAEAGQIEYQTKLEGLDEDWSELSKRNTREVTNLIWKNYLLRMRAKFPDGSFSREFQFEFKVEAPWYEQVWFYCLEASIFLGFMMVVVWIRLRQRFLHAEEPINVTIISTAVGYTFTKVGAYSAIDAISGGAAFMSILLSSLMGIFLKPIERQVEKFVINGEKWLEHHPRIRSMIIGKHQPQIATIIPVNTEPKPASVDKSA